MEIIRANKNLNSSEISRIATKSLIYEVSISPKAGLVSRYSNGSHNDMNFYTFIESAFSLEKYFKKCWEYGSKKNIDENFLSDLRQIGKDAERQMYESTKNINTHKGTIFSLGIIISVVANINAKEKKVTSKKIIENIKIVSKNLLDDLKQKQQNTKGIDAYQKYGLTGARGLAISGYEIVFCDGINKLNDFLKKYNLETSLIILLFYYMSKLDDTNIIGRSSFDELQKIKKMSADEYTKIVENNFSDEMIVKSMEKFNRYFIKKNISPGGSADLIIITLFVYFLHNYSRGENGI